MNIRILSYFAAVLLSLVSCSQKREGVYSARLKGNRVELSMAEYKPAMRNPMKGFREFFMIGTDTKRPEYPYPYGTLIKEYVPWNMIESDIDDGVDKIIAHCNRTWAGYEAQNVKVIPRVFIVWLEPWHGGRPKSKTNIDDLNGWHWPSDIPEETGPYKQIPGSVGAYVEPEDSLTTIQGGYFDPSFPDRVRNLVRKLGQAWDNDPRVAYVEMGIIGEWGEHHDPDISTVYPPHDEPKHIDGRTWISGIEKVLGDSFTQAFKNKKVMVRYAYEFKDYDFGIYWDSWAQPQEIGRGYNEMIARGDYWKTQPVGGEITWNWGDLYLSGFRSFEDCVKDEKTRAITIEQIRNLHCNHLGGITWADFNDEEFKPIAEELQKALGYRFVMERASYPSRVELGEEFSVEVDLYNSGSSPFYYDWPLELAILDPISHERLWSGGFEDVRISQWMPGDNWDAESCQYLQKPEKQKISAKMKIDADIPAGRYIFALAIPDPACGRPALRFANTNYYEGGYHPIGYVGVGVDEKEPMLDASSFFDLQSDQTINYAI